MKVNPDHSITNALRTGLLTVLLVVLPAAMLARPALAQGPEDIPVVKTAQQKRAEALLEHAVQHVTRNGPRAVLDFARQSEFVDRDLYVYAIDTDGAFLASGGASAALVGENVKNYTDYAGKAFFSEMIEIAQRDGKGMVEYQWYNPADSRGDPKMTLFQRVGSIIVAVGYYPPRATITEAKAMLSAALKALEENRDAALAEFQDLNGRFIRNDLYVFVVDVASGRFIAYGATPVMVGSNALGLRDPLGEYIVRDMLAIAERKGSGELSYVWRNPTTGKMETKHTRFRLANGLLVGVGSYEH